jgi:N-acetylneuraminate synthase
MFNKDINISNYKIGNHHPVFIIAEVGVNHNGVLELAKKNNYRGYSLWC